MNHSELAMLSDFEEQILNAIAIHSETSGGSVPASSLEEFNVTLGPIAVQHNIGDVQYAKVAHGKPQPGQVPIS